MDNCYHCTHEVLEGTGVYDVHGNLFCHAGCLAFDAEFEGADESVQALLRNAGIPPSISEVCDMLRYVETDTRYGWFIVQGSGQRAYERVSTLLRTTVESVGFHGRYNATLRAWYVPAGELDALAVLLEHGWDESDPERPRLVRLTRMTFNARERRRAKRAERGRAYWAGIAKGKAAFRIIEPTTKAAKKRLSTEFERIVSVLKDAGGVFNRNTGEWYVAKAEARKIERQTARDKGLHEFVERIGANALREVTA